MIGREAELKHLQNAYLDAFEDGETRVVTIAGEAGVGKSRLLYEFAEWGELRPERYFIFRGRATPESRNRPYGLFRDTLTFRFGLLADDPPSGSWRNSSRAAELTARAERPTCWLPVRLRSFRKPPPSSLARRPGGAGNPSPPHDRWLFRHAGSSRQRLSPARRSSSRRRRLARSIERPVPGRRSPAPAGRVRGPARAVNGGRLEAVGLAFRIDLKPLDRHETGRWSGFSEVDDVRAPSRSSRRTGGGEPLCLEELVRCSSTTT
jgi:hypothetical protein